MNCGALRKDINLCLTYSVPLVAILVVWARRGLINEHSQL